MRHTITITFTTDRKLTQDELDCLTASIMAQVEEPHDRNGDPIDITVSDAVAAHAAPSLYQWRDDLRAAVAAGNHDTIADLLAMNDRNGCFRWQDVQREFGDSVTREQWRDSMTALAIETLADR